MKAAAKAEGKSAGRKSAGTAKEAVEAVGKTAPSRSPLAPRTQPNLPPLAGVRLSTGHASVRYRDRTDVLLVVMAPGTQVAGVLTKSKTASAPVDWCRKQLETGNARALVVNSGNANAFTGRAGVESVREVADAA